MELKIVNLVICITLIGFSWCAGVYFGFEKGSDSTYEDELYQDRLDSMNIVAEEIFPVKNQTVVLTNEGYVSAQYDWENNTKISNGGWILRVTNSQNGVTEFLFDGWNLEKME
jgi:hypothetical protein